MLLPRRCASDSGSGMAEPNLDDELDRAERALERVARALDKRAASDTALRQEMRAAIADLDTLISAAERAR